MLTGTARHLDPAIHKVSLRDTKDESEPNQRLYFTNALFY